MCDALHLLFNVIVVVTLVVVAAVVVVVVPRTVTMTKYKSCLPHHPSGSRVIPYLAQSFRRKVLSLLIDFNGALD